MSEFTTDPLAYSAAAHPGKRAVLDLATGEHLGYRELSQLASRAAGWIARLLGGDPRGERIAYLGRNGIELLILALGAERCGAIFVPLNWRLAPPEIVALVNDCAPRLVVVQPEFAAALQSPAVRTNVLQDIREAAPIALSRLPPERPAILLYTSGTTGRPKGVIVTAGNAFAASLNFASVAELGPASVALSDLPMFHTIGLIAVARSTLSVGGMLLLNDRFIPSRTLAALGSADLGITHYVAVPVMVEALAREPDFLPGRLAGLHALIVGGAPLAAELVERFLTMGVPLVNGYGMSEVGTAIHVPIERDAVKRSAGAVGLPAPHIEVRLVDNGRDVRDGEIGEVWLRGPSVTPGYWNRRTETAAAFSDGWYRSGDLARRGPEGVYSIVDRVKDMYVSGGENVYPAEVEAVLMLHPAIADAAVVGVPDERWGEAGIAFVVPRMTDLPGPDALRAHCLAHLARFKCPARFVVLESIPRSPAGKVLKPALRERLTRGEFK